MATALMAMKMYSEAQQSYHTALRIEPGNEAVVNQLRAVEAKIAAAELQGASPAVLSAGCQAGLPAVAHAACAVPAAERTGMQSPPPATPDAMLEPPAPGLVLKHSVRGGGEVDESAQTRNSFGGRPEVQWSGGDDQKQANSDLAVSNVTNHVPDSAPPRKHVDALQQAGSAAFRAGEHEKANVLFAEAIESANPPNANLHANRSAVLCALLRFEEAIEEADRAVQLKPGWGRGHSRRGNALHAMCKRGDDRWEEARLAYQRALDIDPENAVVRRALQACVEQA